MLRILDTGVLRPDLELFGFRFECFQLQYVYLKNIVRASILPVFRFRSRRTVLALLQLLGDERFGVVGPLQVKKPVVLIGESGTSKTATTSTYLRSLDSSVNVSNVF